MKSTNQGILLVNKPKGKTAFSLVSRLRRILNVRTIGHAGTLDPLATGVMVLLIGRNYTKLSNRFINHDKEYQAKILLGISTDTYDAEGTILNRTNTIPSLEEIQEALTHFQGTILQTPPMHSAKKVNGKKLYELARKGKTIARDPVSLQVQTELTEYTYPLLHLTIRCSKGTYVRSIAHDLGEMLGCGAHLADLVRTKSGPYSLSSCLDGSQLYQNEIKPEEISTQLIHHENH